MDGKCVSKKYWSFTLVETLVAIAVLLIAIVAPLSLAHKSLQSTSVTRDQLIAFYLAQDAIDYMKKIRDQNISDGALWTSRFPNCVRNQEPNCVFTVDTSKGVATAFNTPCPGDICPLLNFDTVTGRYSYHNAWPASVYKRTIRVTPVVTNEEMDVVVTVEWQGGKLGGIYTAHQSMFNLLGNVCRDLSGNIDYTCSGAGGGSGSLCGDGALAGGEQCDGSLFNVTCSSLGYSGGTLSCNADCTANTSGCTSVPTTYALTVSKGGTGSGTVTSNPSGVNCGSDCSENYTNDTSVTLSATPAGGSTFSGWSGACSGSGSCVVTMSTVKNVTATFNTTGPAPDTTAPTAPTNLAATVVSASQIDLSWTASTDAVGVTGYSVERCQGSGCSSFSQIATPSGTSYQDTGLSAGTSYSYRVRAIDAAGNLSGYSNVASATTQTPAPAIVYVSDLTPTSQTNGWGPVEKDMSNGEDAAGDGQTLRIAGTSYPKGIGTHAYSSVTYNLGGLYTRFQAKAGVDDETGGAGSVQFSVYVNGSLAAQSSWKYGGQSPWIFDVNTTGASTLELRVTDASDGSNDDHGDWADAKLTRP